MVKILNHEDFVKFVIDTFGNEFKVLGTYLDSRTKIEMYHSKCDKEFEVIPANFKFRKRCPQCHGTFRKNTKEYKELVKGLVGDEYSVDGEYVRARENVPMTHAVCGYKFNMTPDSFLNANSRCPKCSGNLKKTREEHSEAVSKLTNGEIELIGDYINSKTTTLYLHKTCGTEFEVTPEAITIVGTRCPLCSLQARSGENHYRYNPNLTEEDRMARDMFRIESNRWRDLVFSRDDYTCVVCDEKGGRLNAHHLYSWNSHENLRFETDNGVTLCEECHRSFHSTFGYGNNTRTQFNTFLKTKTERIS